MLFGQVWCRVHSGRSGLWSANFWALPNRRPYRDPQRDQHIRTIQDRGRLGWQKAVGYGRRSLGETAMFRYKTIIGRGLRARTLPAQKAEARVACSGLNRMTRLGMPVSQRIA